MDSVIFIVSSYIGTAAFAISGLLLAVRKELDIIGIFIMAMLTANGGGAIRDVLIGRTPSVLTDISAFYMVFSVCVLSIVLKIHRSGRLERHMLFTVSDAAGLAAFSITGTLIGIDSELSGFGVVVIAFLTAVGGGAVRDILLNEVPQMLYTGFYASVAVVVAISMLILKHFDMLHNIAISCVLVAGFSLRMLAYKYSWNLPKIRRNTNM